MNAIDHLGIGLYSLSDAARLLKTPRRTVSRWVDGYIKELREGEKFYPPAIDRVGGDALSFGDLVELLYVRGFRDRGVGLGEIAKTADEYRKEWKTPYPFATRKFATDGKGLLIKKGGEWEHALTGQQQAFFEELGSQLIHVGDLTTEWRPLGTARAVVLNPDRSFGKPIETSSGAHTYVLSQAYEASHDAGSVGWWYGIEPKAVLDAVQFERDFRVESASVVSRAA
jgi:hypothetical protein